MIDLAQLFSYAGPALAALGFGGASASQRWIRRDRRSLVLRFGKVVTYRNTPKNRRLGRVGKPRVLEPGFNLIMPGIDKMAQVRVREVVRNLGDEEVTLKDMTVFTVDGVLVYHVNLTPEDIQRAIFEVDDLYNSVRLYAIGVMREVLREYTYDQLIGGEAAELNAKLTERVSGKLAEWGLKVTSFSLGDLSPYGQTLSMIQTPAAMELKLKALEDAAVRMRRLGIDPGLAAALIGIPVTAAIGNGPATGKASTEK